MDSIATTLPSGDYRPAFGASRAYWMIIALVTSVILILVHYGAIEWFASHFSGPLPMSVAGALGALCLYAWFFTARPVVQALQANDRELATFARLTDQRIPFGKRLNGVVELCTTFAAENSSAVATACNTLYESVRTSAACGGKPYVDDMILSEFEDEFETLFGRLDTSRTFLISLGLVGTIFGLVLSLTSSGQVPVTPEETKTFSFFLLHGMGVAYLSGLCGWGGAFLLYVFESVARRHADAQCGFFRKRMTAFVVPVIQSEAFLNASAELLNPERNM
jgi:hypothetical protein